MSIISLFPSSIAQSALKFKGSSATAKNREFLQEIFKIREIDEQGQKWSEKNYPGGYTSYASLNELHRFSSTFADLQKLIDQEVKKFTKHLEMDLGHGSLVMSNLWVNIMPPQVVHTMHIHPLSTISGTYYVQTPAQSSAIKFEDPRLGFFMASPPRKPQARRDNQRFISVQPKAGQLILFESWMRHEVPPNKSKQERVSLSFNYDWV
jgi:uncharacterized protein (TIGR02466 family)